MARECVWTDSPHRSPGIDRSFCEGDHAPSWQLSQPWGSGECARLCFTAAAAPCPAKGIGVAIAAVRAWKSSDAWIDAGRLARQRLEPIARAPSSCPSRPRPQRASAARQRPTHGATSAERSWGRAFRATRGARSEVMSGGGVRATRGARSEVGPASRRDAGPGCVCAAGFLPYARGAVCSERRAERGAR